HLPQLLAGLDVDTDHRTFAGEPSARSKLADLTGERGPVTDSRAHHPGVLLLPEHLPGGDAQPLQSRRVCGRDDVEQHHVDPCDRELRPLADPTALPGLPVLHYHDAFVDGHNYDD